MSTRVNVSKTGVMILHDMQLTLTEIEDSTSKKNLLTVNLT